jgi:hypothetical protein
MSLSTTTVTVSEDRTSVSEIAIGEVKLNIVPELSTVSVGFVLPETDSSKYIFNPYRDINSTNVQSALNEFANEVGVAKQNEEPVEYSEGDLWYDIDDNQLKLAREVNGSVVFIPLLSGDPDMDTLNGGDFV